MRAQIAFWAVLASGAMLLGEDTARESLTRRVARLIEQLGDDQFAKREAASRSLEAIGEPALAALKKATSSPDLEIRRRAERLVRAIASTSSEEAIKRELAALRGTWVWVQAEEGGAKLPLTAEQRKRTVTYDGNRWVVRDGGKVYQEGIITFVDAQSDPLKVNLLHTGGTAVGVVAPAILSVKGDLFHYAAPYPGKLRPADFSTAAGTSFYHVYKRVKR